MVVVLCGDLLCPADELVKGEFDSGKNFDVLNPRSGRN